MMELNNATAQAYDILNRALYQYKPSTIVLMTSWGHDSQVSTDIAYKWARYYAHSTNVVVVTLDTGVCADDYTAWCKQQAQGRYSPFVVWANPDVGFQWYADNATGYGFGYTKAFHSMFYYRMLKERTIAKILRHYKKHRYDRIMFVSGVYRAESIDRMNAPEVERHGAAVWVSPVVHWQKPQLEYYRQLHNLPDNPFYNTVGGSGDCLCNWGQFTSLDTMRKHSPKLGIKLAALSNHVTQLHGWGWGEAPSGGLLAERAGQLVLPGIEPLCAPDLCAGCNRSKPKQQEALDDYLTNNIQW